MIAQIVQDKLPELHALCRKHHVDKLWLFGSATREDFTPESDLDFLVVYDRTIAALSPEDRGENSIELYFALRELFSRGIDLLREGAIKNPYFIEELKQTRKLVYAQAA